jgi:AGCS family alanine or glycine:cation symporter
VALSVIEQFLSTASGFIWGPAMLALLLGVGVYLTIGLRAMPWRQLPAGFRLLWRGRHPLADAEGDITPFQALMTALSATIGTGNIAGVATAIALGGPGAVFWMWITALFGMATKYAEAVLAVRFRETDARGMHVGGPMYYIRNGMGGRWRWLGALFALFGMIAAFGIGNMVQSNSVADAVTTNFSLPTWISGVVMAALTAAVILGGIRRIAVVAGKLVPIMAVAYVAGALAVIVFHLDQVPGALAMIVSDAFTGTAATGGFAGAAVWAALRWGVARGIFSNEAGLGSAPIAHAAAKTRNPVRQGMIGMLGTFIDTIVVCTMTALVIVIGGTWTQLDPATGVGWTGAALSTQAFDQGLPGFGSYVVTLGLIVFAFTTVLGWSYYGERCAEYLFGIRVILPYRLLWVAAIVGGAVWKLNLVWLFADVMNGLMAVPNLIALIVLSPVVFTITRDYLASDVTPR